MPPVLLELQYLPPVAYFVQLANSAEVALIEQHENYSKGSYRNRCAIVGANGLLRMSIPLLKGKHQQQAVREVQMAFYEPWPAQHWQSICSAYGRAPFFEEYSPVLRPFFEQPGTSLFDFNWKLLCTLAQLLELPCQLKLTESYIADYPASSVRDLRNQISPKKEAASLNPYPQVFEDRHGFIADLSVIDLLFCLGPEAGQWCKEAKYIYNSDIKNR